MSKRCEDGYDFGFELMLAGIVAALLLAVGFIMLAKSSPIDERGTAVMLAGQEAGRRAWKDLEEKAPGEDDQSRPGRGRETTGKHTR